MSDFENFRREAGNQVLPPAFDELVATSRRRRRTAAATAVVAVAAVLSVVAFGLQGVYGDQTAPAQPGGPTSDQASGTVAPDCAALWDQVRRDVVASGLPDAEARRQADLARLRCEGVSTPEEAPTVGGAAPDCASARPADPAVTAATGSTVSVFFTCAAIAAEVPTPVYAVDRSVPADMTERDRVAFVVGEYLRGPSPEEAEDGYRGGLPRITAAALDDVSLQDGVVTVNFLPSADETLGAFTTTESLALQSALAAGVFQFPSAQELRVTIAGNCAEFWRHLEMTCQTMSAPAPSPTKDASPSPEERPDRLTPTQIVNHPSSSIAAVAVSDNSSQVKAVAWRYCPDQRTCNRGISALTVTSDDFRTSHDIALPAGVGVNVLAAGASSFFVTSGRSMSLVDSDGSVSPVQLDKKASPLVAGEVFVGGGVQGPIGYPHLALNPATAVAHPVSEPPHNGTLMLEQNADGTLVGVVHDYAGTSTGASVVWSADGGATWSEHRLVEDSSELIEVIDSASPDDVMAVVQGGDGATLFPFDTVHRSTDGGATWQTFDESPGDMAYLGWSLVTPDGSLLVHIEAWSDERRGRPSAHPVGLYQSNGSDWADMQYVQDLPESSQSDQLTTGFTLGDYAPTDSGVLRLWIYEYAGNTMFESGPGIHTWAEVPAR